MITVVCFFFLLPWILGSFGDILVVCGPDGIGRDVAGVEVDA